MAPAKGVGDPKLLVLPKPWDDGANDWPNPDCPVVEVEKGPLLPLDPNDEDGDPKAVGF